MVFQKARVVYPAKFWRSRDMKTERETHLLTMTTGKTVMMGSNLRGSEMDSRVVQALCSGPVKHIINLPTLIKNIEADYIRILKK